jgi:hypothetical protein
MDAGQAGRIASRCVRQGSGRSLLRSAPNWGRRQLRLHESAGQREGACFGPMPSGRISIRSRRGSKFASIQAESGSRPGFGPDTVGEALRRTWFRRDARGRTFGSDTERRWTEPASSRAREPEGLRPQGNPTDRWKPASAVSNREPTRLRPGRNPARKPDEPGLARNREAQRGTVSRPGDGVPTGTVGAGGNASPHYVLVALALAGAERADQRPGGSPQSR